MSSLAPGPAGTTPTSHDLPTRPDGTPLRVLLTAKDAVEDRIAGLTAGGDDYVTEPFVLEEVAARLRNLVRHPGRVRSEDLILDRVWQYDVAGQGNVVELYVSYLRRTVDAGHPPMIRTVRDAGHVLEPGRSA